MSWSCFVLSLSYLLLSCLVLCRLEGRLGSFLVVLRVFGGHFWSSWGLFWPLGVVLGRSWEVLGALEAVLAPVDGQGCRGSNFPSVLDRFLDPSWAPKRSQDGAQDETRRPQDDPRGRQDGTQDDQNRSKNRLQKRSRLRPVLRPSWGDVGPILALSWGQFWPFRLGF